MKDLPKYIPFFLATILFTWFIARSCQPAPAEPIKPVDTSIHDNRVKVHENNVKLQKDSIQALKSQLDSVRQALRKRQAIRITTPTFTPPPIKCDSMCAYEAEGLRMDTADLGAQIRIQDKMIGHYDTALSDCQMACAEKDSAISLLQGQNVVLIGKANTLETKLTKCEKNLRGWRRAAVFLGLTSLGQAGSNFVR